MYRVHATRTPRTLLRSSVAGETLTKWSAHVLQQAVLSNPKVTVMWNTTVKQFKGGDCAQEATCMLSHLVLEDTVDPVRDLETITSELAIKDLK